MFVQEEEFLHLLIHMSFVPSVHLLDPAAASALEINDTKVRKLQTRPCGAHKTRHKASSRDTMIIRLLCAPSHWVFVCHHCITSPCDLQEPVPFCCMCTGNVFTDVWKQQYCSLMPLTICFPKNLCLLSVGKKSSYKSGLALLNDLKSAVSFAKLAVK